MASCVRPTSSRWHESISVYRTQFPGDIPTKKIGNKSSFEAVSRSTYSVDYKGEVRSNVRHIDSLRYQSAEQRRKSNPEPNNVHFAKRRVKPPVDSYPVLRKDPDKPPVKLTLPEVAPKTGFRPDEKRRGQPWPFPNQLTETKFPDIDMYTIDKLAHKYRWTTTTGHQLEEAALPVPEIDPASKTFERQADPVRAEIQRYYPGPQEFQQADSSDRHLLREPVPASLPPIETRDRKSRLLKQRLGIQKDNMLAMEKEKLEKVKKLVEQRLVADFHLPRIPNYAGYRPMEPANGILKPEKPPRREMHSTYATSFKSPLPIDNTSNSYNFKRTSSISSCPTYGHPYNLFRSHKAGHHPIQFTFTRDMFSSTDSFEEYYKRLPIPRKTQSVLTTASPSTISGTFISSSISSGLDLPLLSQLSIRSRHLYG